MTSILAFLFVLGVLIFVHELGHFLMARRIGVRVITFSLGFGPKILSFKRGDTEYAVSAIPLGGYVKMAGENPEDNRTGASDEFLSKSKWQRFQVLIMGPMMNIVLAVVVMAVVLYQGADVPNYEKELPVIGSFENGSAAQAGGLQPGDTIVAVNGAPVATWVDLSEAVAPKAEQPITVTVERAGQRIDRQIVPTPVTRFKIGVIGARPRTRPMVISVNRDGPAERAGLRREDIVLAVAGEADPTQPRIIEIIRASQGKPIVFDVVRTGERLSLTITPERIDGEWRIGSHISPYEFRTVAPGPVEAIKMSVTQNLEWSRLIVKTLAGLFTRETPVTQLLGPVAIGQLSGDAASAGWIPLFGLMAMISLNLGLLNLMPIPVLDGGHIAILALEGLSRRDFSMKVKEKVLLAGFVLLLMLMVTVIYNDLTRVQWFQRLMPWR